MVKVKICGITNLNDALIAESLGAFAIGFVFAPSRRRITPEKAGIISRRLSPLTAKIGVFVNEKTERINSAVKEAGLDAAQFHGEESPADIAKARVHKKIKGVRVKNLKDISRALRAYSDVVDVFLFDAYSESGLGGTGAVFDHGLLAKIKRPYILAGGITPSNVFRIIRTVKPAMIDLSSGVEKEKGKKSRLKMRTLFMEVNRAEMWKK